MGVDRRDKTYALRLTEEEFRVFRELAKKYNLSEMMREYGLQLAKEKGIV